MNGNTLKLLAISTFLKVLAIFGRLPSGHIDTFIRVYAIGSLAKLGHIRTIRLLINPISAIRYWEFDFAWRHLPSLKNQHILDVSSPRFFGLYLARKYPGITYRMINPDKKDIEETDYHKNTLQLQNFSVHAQDAVSLPYKKNTFDLVISISVIEHIAGYGDSKAMKEMFRVLRPGGKLILTTHVMKKGRTEYRESDQYALGLKKKKGKYFFERVYDAASLENRIIRPVGIKPDSMEIIGEKRSGWFDDYIDRWRKHKLETIVFDQWYMLTKFKSHKAIESLNGMGVIGLVFIKP